MEDDTQTSKPMTLDRLARMMTDRLDEVSQQMDTRFDAVDKRFDIVEGRLDSVEQRLGRVEFNVSEFRDDFRHFEEGEILDLQKRVTALERNIKRRPAA